MTHPFRYSKWVLNFCFNKRKGKDIMAKVDVAKYVLVARGTVLLSGDDPKALFASLDLTSVPDARVKSWRQHAWVEGLAQSVHNTPHCQACKTIRQVKGRNDDDPCKYPEQLDDTVEVYALRHEHRDDVCCTEHEHHVTSGHPHVNCFLR